MSNSIPKINELESGAHEQTVRLITRWVDEVIIKQNFCPFAKSPRFENKIRFSVTTAKNTDSILEFFFDEILKLDKTPEIETTLIIFQQHLKHFDDYLDVLDIAQQCLSQWGYDGQYQLASFHPQYIFEGEKPDAVSNYTNRSPLPIIHIIREQSINAVIKYEDQGVKIAQRNIEHANKLGVSYFKPFLQI